MKRFVIILRPNTAGNYRKYYWELNNTFTVQETPSVAEWNQRAVGAGAYEYVVRCLLLPGGNLPLDLCCTAVVYIYQPFSTCAFI